MNQKSNITLIDLENKKHQEYIGFIIIQMYLGWKLEEIKKRFPEFKKYIKIVRKAYESKE